MRSSATWSRRSTRSWRSLTRARAPWSACTRERRSRSRLRGPPLRRRRPRRRRPRRSGLRRSEPPRRRRPLRRRLRAQDSTPPAYVASEVRTALALRRARADRCAGAVSAPAVGPAIGAPAGPAGATHSLHRAMPSHGLARLDRSAAGHGPGRGAALPAPGRPDAIIFDETYYIKDALALLRFGHEREVIEDANDMILARDAPWNQLDIFTDSPAFVVHPPVGKWVIATGEWAFGMIPFGWRFGVAVLGTLSVLMTARILRRLTRSDSVGIIAGLLVALDGLHLVMSRTALLDISLMFFVLAAFGLLLLDRDAVRRRAEAWATLWARQPGHPWTWTGRAAVADARRGGTRPGLRGQVERALVRGLLRPAERALGRGAAPGTRLPGTRSAACCAGTPCPRSSASWGSGCSSTWPPGRAGCSATVATTGTGRPHIRVFHSSPTRCAP